MKKIYARPVAEVIELKTTDIIKTSGGLLDQSVYNHSVSETYNDQIFKIETNASGAGKVVLR